MCIYILYKNQDQSGGVLSSCLSLLCVLINILWGYGYKDQSINLALLLGHRRNARNSFPQLLLVEVTVFCWFYNSKQAELVQELRPSCWVKNCHLHHQGVVTPICTILRAATGIDHSLWLPKNCLSPRDRTAKLPVTLWPSHNSTVTAWLLVVYGIIR